MLNKKALLSFAILTYLGTTPGLVNAAQGDINVTVRGNVAQMKAKRDSQQQQIITSKDIEQKQAKSAEDIVFNETGVSRTVDAMGRVGVSIRGADPRHTLILIDGQPAIGEFAKYMGAADELSRIGAENLDRIEITQGAASAKYGADAIGGVVNVITKKPADTPGLQFNMESLRIPGSTGAMPYSNFYLRADSGLQGKTAFSVYGSKREILPVYAAQERLEKGIVADDSAFGKNSLRYSGTSSNIGVSGKYLINDTHNLDFRVDKYTDDLYRYIKHTKSITEPSQQFKRLMNRETAAFNYSGQIGENTNYNVELNFTKLKEDDVTILNYEGYSPFKGTDRVKYIDNVDHRQTSLKINGVSVINDRHTLSYGIGTTREKGVGSRLKNAPKSYTRNVNPWDYSKNLEIITTDTGEKKLLSNVHDYKLTKDKEGTPSWNYMYEWYNYDKNDGGKTEKPLFTLDDWNNFVETREARRKLPNYDFDDKKSFPSIEKYNDYIAFGKKLAAENEEANESWWSDESRVENFLNAYYNNKTLNDKEIKFNGKTFRENVKEFDNKVTVGEASINKTYLYVQDKWQLDDATVFSPSLRIDNSNHFGTNATFNLGLTHNINNNRNRRLKFNVGTGYSEPGLGELYYNWEMYSGIPIAGGLGGGAAKLGWYWMGNPNLKPEKSLNIDLGYEVDTKKDNFRASLFHNKIKDYLSIYFTGGVLDFYPEYNELTQLGGAKYLYAPDLIYSFKNIGNATITGFESEWKHKVDEKWSTRIGYTYLRALNNSDPTLPSRLLDKPKHKIDLGINYDDQKTGWSGSLYANYYINMLDSNELSGKGNYLESYVTPPKGSVINTYYEGKTYKRKTYGIWNFIVQKKWDDATAYFAIDNLFNHRDDARALQARVFRFGINFKFGPDGKVHKYTQDEAGNEIDLGPVELKDFLHRPWENNIQDGITFIGQYSITSNTSGGTNRPHILTTLNSTVGSAKRNLLDKNEHGLSQKIETGINYRNKDTNFKILGSLNSNTENDTSISTSQHKGLNHIKLEEADLTQKAKEWDFSFGKLKEQLGTTGYYFNDSFVGARAKWTGKKTQVTIGYGDFKQSTGVNDSAYTNVRYQKYMRAPRVDEFLGTSVDYLASYPKLKELVNKRLEAAGNPNDVNKEFDIIRKALIEEKPAKDADEDLKKEYEKLRKKIGNDINKEYAYINSVIVDRNPNLSIERKYKKALEENDTAKQNEIVRKFYDSAKAAYPNLFDPSYIYRIDFPDQAFEYTRDVEKAGKTIKTGELAVSKNTFGTTEYNNPEEIARLYPDDRKVVPSSTPSILTYEKDPRLVKLGESIPRDIPINDPSPLDGESFYRKWLEKNGATVLEGYRELAKAHLKDDKHDDAYYTSLFYSDNPKYDPKNIRWDYDVSHGKFDYSTWTRRPYTEEEKKEILAKKAIVEKESKEKLEAFLKDKKANDVYFVNKKYIKLRRSDKEIFDDIIKMNNVSRQDKKASYVVGRYFDATKRALQSTESSNDYPRMPLAEVSNVYLPASGVVLNTDSVPSLKRAFFLDLRHEITPRLGANLWYLYSTKDSGHDFFTPNNQNGNDIYHANKLANVLGLGLKYQIGLNTSFSFDMGKNYTRFGSYMNGSNIYEYTNNNTEVNIIGHKEGSAPSFYTFRFDIGKADFDTKGSWSAFVDYKYFQHGSFFGGNGTDSLPDRYLDGIKSFTVGGAYVPATNFMVKASYTFGAKGINQRDTLFGPENFKLGDYSRIEMIYKF